VSWPRQGAAIAASSIAERKQRAQHATVLLALRAGAIHRLHDSTDKCADGFLVEATGKYEASIVGFPCFIRAHRLIDHQITAALLDAPLEALDRLEKLDELFVRLSAGEMNSARAQAEYDFALDALTLIASIVQRVRLIPAAVVRHDDSPEGR
jgi:hypothetical protein